MNYNKNCHCGMPHEEKNSRLYVPTTTCLHCGKEVSLSPEELITHLHEIGEGTYLCPLCRLMGYPEQYDVTADDKHPEDDNNLKFFKSMEAVAAGIINLLGLGSWVMLAAKYAVPEDLLVETLTRASQLAISRSTEDRCNDSDEMESDSDEATATCTGSGSTNPPEGPDSGTAERGGSGFSVKAGLRLQTAAHLIFRIQDTTT